MDTQTSSKKLDTASLNIPPTPFGWTGATAEAGISTFVADDAIERGTKAATSSSGPSELPLLSLLPGMSLR